MGYQFLRRRGGPTREAQATIKRWSERLQSARNQADRKSPSGRRSSRAPRKGQ